VSDGDPFVVENAARLQTIAWAIVGLELMHIAVVVLANGVWVGTQKVDIEWKFPLTQLLTILLLFVLARVLDQGARMRDELEATV
jgi:Na+-translocating ferredoxin:NAD+ oxidoreductase RnfD subunit